MSAALDNAILEAQKEMDNVDMLDQDGELIDYVAGLTDHMIESEPDYTKEDIDDDVKDIAEEGV